MHMKKRTEKATDY